MLADAISGRAIGKPMELRTLMAFGEEMIHTGQCRAKIIIIKVMLNNVFYLLIFDARERD